MVRNLNWFYDKMRIGWLFISTGIFCNNSSCANFQSNVNARVSFQKLHCSRKLWRKFLGILKIPKSRTPHESSIKYPHLFRFSLDFFLETIGEAIDKIPDKLYFIRAISFKFFEENLLIKFKFYCGRFDIEKVSPEKPSKFFI
jgi:hypothetical protein